MKQSLLFVTMALMAAMPKAVAQDNDPDSKYIRNSLYMIKLDCPPDNPKYKIAYDDINMIYDGIDFGARYERYNNFSLSERHLDFANMPKIQESEYEVLNAYNKTDKPFVVPCQDYKEANDQLIKTMNDMGLNPDTVPEEIYAGSVIKYFIDNAFANKLVAKWHNKPGTQEGIADFDENLSIIMELGLRGLSEEAKANAKVAENLTNIVAGSENKLLNNTYVCVTRYYYANADEFNATFIAPLKQQLEKSDNSLAAAALKGTIEAITSSLKGYFVSVNAYLFRLEWNNDLYNDFYANKWNDPKKFFDTSNYRLIYVGKSGKRVPASLSMKQDTNDAELLRRAVVRSTDAAFAALQRDYEEFRPMSSLHVIDGKLAAYIGTKEGIKEGDKFEVFEAVVSEENPNMIDWKPVGKIKVAKNGLWDNREGAGQPIEGRAYDKKEEQVGNSSLKCTYFEGKVGKIGEGNLIRLSGK